MLMNKRSKGGLSKKKKRQASKEKNGNGSGSNNREEKQVRLGNQARPRQVQFRRAQ